jgi:hypothetical protein
MDEIIGELRAVRDNQGSFMASTDMRLLHHNELLETFSTKTFVEVHD